MQLAADIELRNLVCRYGATEVVHGLELAIKSGEFFTLLGPSGCGKSTTLAAIAGFVSPFSGQILLGGHDITHLPPAQRPTNCVFQNYALFPHMTVAQNVEYGLKRRNVARAERKARVLAELERVGLEGFAKRRPAQLSGGQQQRVALARALVNRPSVLLLDEPLSALDLLMRKQLREALKRLQREVGCTFIFVTHDQSEALSLSDRIAVMNAGKIEQIGSPEDIYQRPQSRFVAEFIGTANLLPCQVSRNSTGFTVSLQAGMTVQLAHQQGWSLRSLQADGLLLLRPEHLHFCAPDSTRGFPARLSQCSYGGDHYEISLQLEGGSELKLKTQTLPKQPMGALCHIHFEPQQAQLVPV